MTLLLMKKKMREKKNACWIVGGQNLTLIWKGLKLNRRWTA